MGSKQLGILLAERLGIKVLSREGHDLVAPCIACRSSDAFRIHEDLGIAQCYSCNGRWSPFELVAVVLHDRKAAIDLASELGILSGYTPNT